MKTNFETNPAEIEKKSFGIISDALKDKELKPEEADIIKRVIHTTADFDYAENLVFSETAVNRGLSALKKGCTIVTDTEMARSGINKKALEKLGCRAVCYMSDSRVAEEAKKRGITRAMVSMEKACETEGEVIIAVGNAPTALINIFEFCKEGKLDPSLVIAVPVGFVNVVEAKELIIASRIPHIAAKGRKGGSTVAAAIVNALMYKITGRS
ncbi:MAG: precorrin-8X methylmutase [Lachnospiraceae bacterium]|nr:precorrin-8X methylmutase [Lachnospiraceae bacterium]